MKKQQGRPRLQAEYVYKAVTRAIPTPRQEQGCSPHRRGHQAKHIHEGRPALLYCYGSRGKTTRGIKLFLLLRSVCSVRGVSWRLMLVTRCRGFCPWGGFRWLMATLAFGRTVLGSCSTLHWTSDYADYVCPRFIWSWMHDIRRMLFKAPQGHEHLIPHVVRGYSKLSLACGEHLDLIFYMFLLRKQTEIYTTRRQLLRS